MSHPLSSVAVALFAFELACAGRFRALTKFEQIFEGRVDPEACRWSSE
jgi:hypothetical protein